MSENTGPATSGRDRKQTLILVTLIVGGLVLLGVLLGGGGDEPEPGSTLSPAEIDDMLGPVEVVYQVTGDARDGASITVETPSGTEQMDVSSLPLMNKAGGQGLRMEFRRGQFVYISAQNRGDIGSVTCSISVDGEVISENTSTADYGIATCKGQS